MAGLLLKHVCKTYPNGLQAIRDFNLEVRDREYLVLMGPSGCGKSTLLRMVAGLEEITSGRIFMDGQDVSDADPRDRNLAMVFKNSTLYPGMTVYDNMAFALRMGRLTPGEISRRIEEAAKALGIEKILEEEAENLTDLDRRRVLLARAIVRRPEVLLLDGVLSGLDKETKALMGGIIRGLYRALGTTVIHVTDDLEVAGMLASRIVVMQDGVIRQTDSPKELYWHPCCKFVAGYIGEPRINLFMTDAAKCGETIELSFDGFRILLPENKGKALLAGGYDGKRVVLGVRPEDLRPVDEKEASGMDGVIETELLDIEMNGRDVYWHFDVDESSHTAKAGEFAAGIGDKIYLAVDKDRVHVFDWESEKTITD